MTINIASKQMKYLICFFSLAQKNGTVAGIVTDVSYSPPLDSPNFAKLHTSIYLPMDIQVSVNGKHYIESKQKTGSYKTNSYADTQLCVKSVLGKYLSVDKQEFLTSKYAHVVPINPVGYDYLNLS